MTNDTTPAPIGADALREIAERQPFEAWWKQDVSCYAAAYYKAIAWRAWQARAALASAAQPAGRVYSANCEYAVVQWCNQTSDKGGGDPKNARSWPIAGDAVYLAQPAPKAAPAAQGDAQLHAIRRAVRDYHFALDSRRHGGVAADEALRGIERALGMRWQQGAEAAARAAKEGGEK